MRKNIEPTLSIVTEVLRKKGFKAGFMMEAKETIKCIETEKEYLPSDLQIIKMHRFEGESDPGDNSIVYAVECSDGQKGIIIAAYGMYGSAQINNFMKNVGFTKRGNVATPVQQHMQH